jgi:hypothetical protein
MVKLWVVAVTVRLTVVVSLAAPLVPVIVTRLAAGAMVAKVAIVMVMVDVDEPLSMTLPPLAKLHVAPAGKLEQLLGVKLTVPVKPLAGVSVNVTGIEFPAETL